MKTLLVLCLAAQAHAKRLPMGDLESFIQSTQSLQKVMADPATQRGYRKSLERYSSPAVPVSSGFDQALAQLARLRSQIRGLDAKLVTPAKPMAFQYTGRGGVVFRFERIARPFHSVWLLENLREAEPKACTARDSLLLDRWTPLLKDAQIFAVEKNEKFLGATVTLVPVEGNRLTYLLAVPQDPKNALPAKLLGAFLGDFQEREKPWMPLAQLSEDGKKGYQIFALDKNGAPAKRLGPPDGFRLVDPMAKTIASTVATRCSPAPSSTALAVTSMPQLAAREPASVANLGAAMPAPTPMNTTGAPTPKEEPSAKALQSMPLGGEGTDPQARNAAPKPSTTVVTNNITVPAGTTSTAGTVGVLVQPQIGVGVGTVVGSPKETQKSATQNLPASSTPVASNRALSPVERRMAEAMNAGRQALASGKPLSQELMRDIARGLGTTQDPELKKLGKESLVDLYLKGAGTKGIATASFLEKHYPETARELWQQINSDLCKKCPDCELCQEAQKQSGGQN